MSKLIRDTSSQKALRRARSLLKISTSLSAAYTRKRVAQIIVNEGFNALGAHNGDIAIQREDGALDLVAYRGFPKEFVKKWSRVPTNTPLISVEVIKSRKPVYIKDVKDISDKYQVAKSFLSTSGAKATVYLPIIVNHTALGVMQFNFKESKQFPREERIFMNTIAHQCAQAFERVLALEDLQCSKDQLEGVLRNVADGIVVENKDGEITFANETSAKLLGFNSSEAMNNKSLATLSSSLIHIDGYDKHLTSRKKTLKNLLVEKVSGQTLVRYFNRKIESEKWLVIKATILKDSNGKKSLRIITLQDITEVKEMDLRKDDFISMASHELKTPLTSLRVFLELLQRQIDKLYDTKSIDLLEKAQMQMDRLQKLVNDLLDVSRIQQGKLLLQQEIFPLDGLVKNTVEELQLVHKDYQILTPAIYPITVQGDKVRIYQVIHNLITNAMKYSPPGSRVWVRCVSEGSEACISVKDEGIGISKDQQGRIFDRFYQVQALPAKRQAGLGMGLYIAQQVIRQQNGSITLTSSVGKGTTFEVRLPQYKK